MANPFDQFDEGAGASATNPFDQFDASASTVNPFDQFDGKETPKASTKKSGASVIPGAEEYTANPPKTPEESLGQKSLGIGEAGLTALTGAAAPFLGMLGGTVQSLQQASQGELPDWKKNVENIAEATTFQPRTETGQHIVEKALAPAGEALQALGPVAPHFVVGQPIVGTKMLLKGKERVEAAKPSTSLSALDEHIAAEKAAAPVESTSPEGAGAFNKMAQDISVPDNVKAAEGTPGMGPQIDPTQATTNMAGQLSEMGARDRGAAAQEVLAKRQAELDQTMQQQVTLEQNARMRQQQEAASAYSPEYQEHVQAVEQAKQATADAQAAANAAEAAKQQEALGSRARQEAQQRADAAQEQLRLRQVEMEETVKRQTNLDLNAAERKRQLEAPAVSDIERTRMDAAAFEAQKAKWAAEDARLAVEADKSRRMQQVEIDDTQHAGPGEIYGAQYGTHEGIGRVDENGMPIRADLSMEAQNLQNPLQRNLWGDEIGPALGQQRSMTAALDTLQHTPFKGDARDVALAALGEPRASFNTRTRGQGGAVLNPFERQVQAARDEAPIRWFTSSPEAGRKTSYSLESQAARPNAEGQRYGPGQYIAQSRDFSSVYGGPEGRMYTVEKPFSNAFDTTKASNEKIYQSLVERTGSRTAANQMLQKAGYDAITFTSPRGDKLANIFNEKPLQDIGPAREKVRQQELTLQEYEPGKGPLGKQRGVIRIPGSSERAVEKLKGIEAFRANLKGMAVDRTSPEEFLASQQGQPDIQQNIGQRFSNNISKGSIYTADRLNNPGYTRVTARFREADSLAKGQQQAIVHDIYAPTMRALSDGEKANVWGALKKMEESGVRVSDEKLIGMAFNQKERDAIRIHQSIMDDMVPKINAALDAAGMSHINPQSAYVAAKLSGTFRKVMLDKDNNVIGALGDRTKAGLAKQEAEFMKLYPEAVAGKEQTMGPRANSSSMTDVINFLADKDPHMAEYLQASKEAGAKEAMNFRGAKTHTMEKKGVVGMAGNKPWESAVTNAREGFDAQVAYLNRMLEWAEKAKAEAETRPIIDGLKGTQPKAMQLASDYRDFALGKNPYSFAKVADAVGNWLSTTAGGKLSYANDIARGTKQAVNIKLLAANPGFLISNIAQPLRNMPELAAFLKARGMENGEAFGLGSMSKVAAQMGTGRYSPIMMKAMDYAAEHHVYASDLIDQRSSTNKAFSGDTKMEKAGTALQALDHAAQAPASKIEATTRKAFFLTVVDMLHENGIREQDGLFDIASNLTDRGMNRYSMEEAPVWTKALGSIGKGPYNLMSFKFNELSRFASMVREFNPTDLRTITPMATALAMQVATAGVMGTMGYVEANEIVKAISKALGSPTSITKILLDNADKHIVGPVTVKDLAYGPASTATGVDLSGRMGIGSIMGDVTSPADIALPGITSLYTGAKSAYDLAKDPSKYNAMKAAVDILPGGNLLDRQFFSVNKGTDKEMGFNRNKVETGVLRNDADKMAKNFGMTGVNESGKKSLLYENKNIDQFYIDKRGEAVDRMGKDLFTDGKISPESIEKYKKAQGTMQNLNTTITDAIKRNTIPADKRDLLQAAAEAQLNPNKIKRRFH